MTAPPVSLNLLPKVLLHDHLDGGLRPTTLIELASDPAFTAQHPDFTLPSYDADKLAAIIQQGANSGSLVEYLKPFEYTVAVMQTPENLHRIAMECVLDLAADGVVYAESRFAPGLSTAEGLTEPEVVTAILTGFNDGMAAAAQAGHPIQVRALLCGLRQWEPQRNLHTARIAADFYAMGAGVVGFDIAGPELGFPPSAHAAAFELLRERGVPVTIHAGEAAGTDSVADALAMGARRLGHGVRILDDVDAAGRLGLVARQVYDQRITLETCPCSNVHTGAVASLDSHALPPLYRAGFAVTINTDNRLMSGTSMTNEFRVVTEELGLDVAALREATITAARGAFIPPAESEALIKNVIEPGFAVAFR